jgi:transposase
MDLDVIEKIGGWDGFRVTGVERREGKPPQIRIRLEPIEVGPYRCGTCGEPTQRVHERVVREVRDLPLFDAETVLDITVLRVWCERCGGPKRMAIDWLHEHQRITRRLIKAITDLTRFMPIEHVARHYGVHWHTVKRLDKSALRDQLGPPDFSGVRIIGIDEFALHKGHRYATVVVDLLTRRVLWVGAGRGREDLQPFFELLGPQCLQIEAAVMDMNGCYPLEVRRHCPQAAIVFDLFHVIAKYGREVIDRVRVDRANELRADQAQRRLVKSARWLLLKNRDALRPEQDVELEELLAANRPLFVVYVLRDALRELWRYRHSGHAQRAWRSWYRKALRSGIAPLRRFAQKLRPYLAGILAHCQHPYGTNLIEGINNRIKVIKRMAYGYRDEEYFFLKIRAAFPGHAR